MKFQKLLCKIGVLLIVFSFTFQNFDRALAADDSTNIDSDYYDSDDSYDNSDDSEDDYFDDSDEDDDDYWDDSDDDSDSDDEADNEDDNDSNDDNEDDYEPVNADGFNDEGDGIYLYENGKRSDFTGIVTKYGKACYVKKGKLQSSFKGIYEYDNVLYAIYKGYVDTSANGDYYDNKKTYLVKKGIVVKKSGLISVDGFKYYVKKGIVQTKVNGVKKIKGTRYYFDCGVVATEVSTIIKIKKSWYVVENGIVKRKTSKRCNKILKLRKKYPEGKRWTNANGYLWKAAGYSGYGCAGFSFIASDAAYGKKARIIKHKKFLKVKSGDIIRLANNTHSVVVLEKLHKGVIVAEGNYCESIHWFRYISFKELKSSGTYVQTRK